MYTKNLAFLLSKKQKIPPKIETISSEHLSTVPSVCHAEYSGK
jgi:hypothetical protein